MIPKLHSKTHACPRCARWTCVPAVRLCWEDLSTCWHWSALRPSRALQAVRTQYASNLQTHLSPIRLSHVFPARSPCCRFLPPRKPCVYVFVSPLGSSKVEPGVSFALRPCDAQWDARHALSCAVPCVSCPPLPVCGWAPRPGDPLSIADQVLHFRIAAHRDGPATLVTSLSFPSKPVDWLSK